MHVMMTQLSQRFISRSLAASNLQLDITTKIPPPYLHINYMVHPFIIKPIIALLQLSVTSETGQRYSSDRASKQLAHVTAKIGGPD